MKKIIQMPLQIPDIQESKLRQVLSDRLTDILQKHDKAYTQKAHAQSVFATCINPFINNIRDINRLCNSVNFKLTGISSEVDFSDMVAISAIEIFITPLYEWIKDNKPVLTGRNDFSSIGRQNKSQQEWRDFYRCEIQNVLQKNSQTYTGTNDIELILNSLSCLFPHFGEKIGKIYSEYDFTIFRRFNQIAHPEKFDRYFNLDLASTDFKKSDILNATYDMDISELENYLLEQDQNGISYEFLEDLRTMIPEISSDRSKIITTSLINVSEHLSPFSNHNILFLGARSLAEHMIIDLLDKIEVDERFPFFLDLLRGADNNVLSSMASIINMFELSYGRLAAKGKEHTYKKVFSLEQLIEIETVFSQRAKSLLVDYNMFDLYNWRMVFYLLKNFDAEYIDNYFSEAFSDSSNIVKYLSGSVSQVIGSRTMYNVRNDYKEYLTEDRISEAIERQRKSGELFLQSKEVQNACAAFALVKLGKENDEGYIEQSDVDLLLDSWQKEC